MCAPTCGVASVCATDVQHIVHRTATIALHNVQCNCNRAVVGEQCSVAGAIDCDFPKSDFPSDKSSCRS